MMQLDLLRLNRFVDVDERLSGAFTYDHYTCGLRRVIKELALNGLIGSVRLVPLNVPERRPERLAILLGDSNRAKIRYPYIKKLLDETSNQGAFERHAINLEQTDYFQYLYRRYATLSVFQRIRGRRNCLQKVRRTLRLYEYFSKSKSFKGFSSGGKVSSIPDFPLAMELSGTLVEFDGSHRRCVAYYDGCRKIESIVVQFAELDEIFSATNNSGSYFSTHWQEFLQTANVSDTFS